MFLPLIVHDESVGIASCVGGLGNDSNAAVNGEGSAPVRPIFWLSRDVFDSLFATEVGTGRGEAEMADKLHPSRLVRLTGQAHGSRTDGFRLPRPHPQGRTFRNQIFRPNIKAARARRRFRSPRCSPLLLRRVQVKSIVPVMLVLQNTAPDLMAKRDASLGIRDFKTIGIVQNLHPAHPLRQFRNSLQKRQNENQGGQSKSVHPEPYTPPPSNNENFRPRDALNSHDAP